MTAGCVAIVSPREDRRNAAKAWAPLLRGRASLRLCATLADAADADLLALDAECPDLAQWYDRGAAEGRGQVVVFGAAGDDAAPALPWGRDGEEVLAAISDLLDRRDLLDRSDEIRESLRASGDAFAERRRRLASPVTDDAGTAPADAAAGIDRRARLGSAARRLGASATDAEFGDLLGEVVARALDSFEAPREPAPTDAAPGAGNEIADFAALLAQTLAARGATSVSLARKTQSEHVVRTLRSGLLKVDAGERVVLVNPALAEILEADPAALEGLPLSRALPRDPHVVEMLRAALGQDELPDDVETFLTSAAGRRVPVSLRASRLGESAAPATGLLVLLSDLARRKEIEEEIRRAERLAALGRLSAGVAHEVRNPLAGIRTTAELLRERVAGDDRLARFVEVILEEAERLDRIVGSLLQFAKPSPPRRAALRPGELMDRARSLAASRAAERGVSVRVVETATPAEASADRDQLLQVLLNLVLNAIDATPPGGEVVLRTEADDREVRFLVEDGGEGVPARLRERVFDPFFTTKPGGTGLGLSISQNILRQHGGRLRLERPEGGASRAVATLPRHAPGKVHANPGGATWRTS